MTTIDIWDLGTTPAERYERVVLPAVVAPWAPRVVDLARPAPGERVLDVACGTGIVGWTIAAWSGRDVRVFGVDLDADMLRIGRAAGGDDRVCALRGDAQALPFADARFDVVFCQLGLMLIPDRGRALCEMRRVLTSGGRAGLMVWGPIEECPVFESWARTLERHLGSEAAAAAALPFDLGDAAETRMAEWMARTTPEVRAAMLADMRAANAPFEGERGLEFPISALLTRAIA